MSDLVLAGAEDAPTTAAELAARIPVPRRLPERYDGEPLRHLSPSSYALWVSCPEAWRRRYIKGEKPPPSGSTPPCRPTTGGSSTTATGSRSTTCSTSTASCGPRNLRSRRTSAASDGRRGVGGSQ